MKFFLVFLLIVSCIAGKLKSGRNPSNGEDDNSNGRSVSIDPSGGAGEDGDQAKQIIEQLKEDFRNFNWTDIRNLLFQIIQEVNDPKAQEILTEYLNRWLSENLAIFLTNELSVDEKQNISALSENPNNFTKIQQSIPFATRLTNDADQTACFVIISAFYAQAYNYLLGIDLLQNLAAEKGNASQSDGNYGNWEGKLGRNFDRSFTGSFRGFDIANTLLDLSRH